ncbi:MAG: flagellin [bacterium]
MVINFNFDAINARNQERLHGLSAKQTVERLSSGLRINKGADDPSGLAIAAQAKAQVRGISTALGNVQESIALYNLRDAYFEQIDQMMNRMRDLAVRASNDATLTQRDLEKLDSEAVGLKSEIDRMALSSYKVDGGRLLYNPGDLDVIWVMDITNSMTPYANSLYNDSAAMFNQFQANGFDLQMGVVGFDSMVRQYTDTQTFHSSAAGFMNDVGILRSQIPAHPSGTENGLTAVNTALGLGGLGGAFRPTAQHVVILISDEDSDDFYTPLTETNYLDNMPFAAPPGPPMVGPYRPVNDPTAHADPTNIKQNTINALIGADATLHTVGVVESGTANWAWLPGWWNLGTAKHVLQNSPDMDYQEVATAPGVDGGVYTLDTAGAWVSSITNTMLATGGPWDADFQVGPDEGHIINGQFESVGTSSLGIAGVSLAAVASAQNSITILDRGIATLADMRTNTAQIVKRLGHIANDLSSSLINLSAYKSNIEDADIAVEVVNSTITQIVSRTTTSAQVQANANPENVKPLVDIISNSERVEEFNASFYNKN